MAHSETVNFRKFMFIQGPSVADPAYQYLVCETIGDVHISFSNTWKTRWAIRIINWLLPRPSEETVEGNRKIQQYFKEKYGN